MTQPNAPVRIGLLPHRADAVIANGLVFLSGLVAQDTTADTAGQTRQILAAIDELLNRSGSGKRHLVSATIWLADIGQRDAVNTIWNAWLEPGYAPARACVGAALAGPQHRVEIAIVAQVSGDARG